jgi:uncharacterized membrane protein
MLHRCGISIALLVVLGTGTDALADFRVCNHSLVQVYVSFGWNDPRFGRTSQGWWNLPIGNCASVLAGKLTSRFYYLYATGEHSRIWGASDTQTGGSFCVRKSKYIAHNRDHTSQPQQRLPIPFARSTIRVLTPPQALGPLINCEAAGLQGRKFRQIDVGGYSDFTYNLTSRPDDRLPPKGTTPTTPPSPAPTSQAVEPGPAGTACQRYPNLC